jgi:hypothetical protein
MKPQPTWGPSSRDIENLGKQLTSINILSSSLALGALSRFLGCLRLQTLADVAEAAFIHGALEGIALPPEAEPVLVNSDKTGHV